MFNALLDLIFPRSCAGCGAWDETLCRSCTALFSGPWLSVADGTPYLQEIVDDGLFTTPFPVWVLSTYADTVKHVIVHWKNVQDRYLDDAMSGIMARALTGILAVEMFPAWGRRPVVVVPVASARRRRRSGCFVTGVLARAVAERFAIEYRDILRQAGPSVLRRGLTRRLPSREPGIRRRSGSIAERSRKTAATRVVGNVAGCDVILVDDVVTSGATLAGASRAIRSGGGRVIGALALAHTAHP